MGIILVVSSLIAIIPPLGISILISSGDWLSRFEGSSSVWIGFWGSYLGGIIGTVGVIYVAYLQSKQQRELNRDQNEEQRKLNEEMLVEQREQSKNQIIEAAERLERAENYNRDRMSIETQVRLLEDYIETLKELQNDLYIVKFGLVELIGFDNLRKVHEEEKVRETTPYSESLQKSKNEAEENYLEVKHCFKEFSRSYFSIKFEDVFYRNILLKDRGVDLEETDDSFHHKLDDIINMINSKLKELDINLLIETYADEERRFYGVEGAWRWVRNEKANAYNGLVQLMDELK